MLDELSPDVEAVVSPARVRLTAAVRHLVDVVLTAETLDEAELAAACDTLEALNTTLDGRAPAGRPDGVRSRNETSRHDYTVRSPLVGRISPVAPPFDAAWRDGRLISRGVFGAACEGPPGFVHGGWIALAFDEILGMANVAGGNPGMTGKLTVRYLRPTPLHVETEIAGWIERVEGRRTIVKGSVSTVGGAITAEAEGLFVAPTPEMAAKYFGTED